MENRPMLNYENGRIAVDAVIFTIKNNALHVYLNTREIEPFLGKPELPGGLLLDEETAEETLARKLQDVIGVREVFFDQFHTFTRPDRDPRTRTVSIAFIALIAEDKVQDSSHFHLMTDLPAEMAFDHKEIIKKAYAYVKDNLNDRVVRQFLPQYFPLNQLQMVYEVVGGKKIDNRNFRKKMMDAGIVKKAKKVQKSVAHRPAALWEFV